MRDPPSHSSTHVCHIWKESMQNCRRDLPNFNSFIKNSWLDELEGMRQDQKMYTRHTLSIWGKIRQTDRQQTGRQAGRQTDRQTDRQGKSCDGPAAAQPWYNILVLCCVPPQTTAITNASWSIPVIDNADHSCKPSDGKAKPRCLFRHRQSTETVSFPLPEHNGVVYMIL